MPTEQDFTRVIVQTRPGEPNSKSGIPPALFTLAVSNFLEKRVVGGAALQVKFERPLKVNVSPELMQSLTESSKSILSAYPHEDIVQLMSTPTKSTTSATTASVAASSTDRRHISSIALTTSQILIQAQIQEDGEEIHTLQLGFYGSSLNAVTTSHSFNDMALGINFLLFLFGHFGPFLVLTL